jgi:hypothetical protein
VRELLGDGVQFERHQVEWSADSVEAYAEFMENSFGPLINARQLLGNDLVRETYVGYLNDVNEADDGTLRFHGEYLVSTVNR